MPRKLMDASARTALLKPIVRAGSSTGAVFGSMWIARIRGFDAPISRALLI